MRRSILPYPLCASYFKIIFSHFDLIHGANVTHCDVTSRNSRELIFVLNVLRYKRVLMIDMSAGASATRGKQTLLMGLA